jgi:hypothetical protein
MTGTDKQFRDRRNVRDGGEAQEREHHGLFQRDCGQHQHAKGGAGRSDGNLPAESHVAHGINHPRGCGYFTT